MSVPRNALFDMLMKARNPAPTYLQPNEEAAFRQWMQQIGHTKQRGFSVSENYDGNDYDYRGFFKKYGPVNVGAGGHLTDEFKLPNHLTFSNESVYNSGRNSLLGGNWNGSTFTPSAQQLAAGLRRKTE